MTMGIVLVALIAAVKPVTLGYDDVNVEPDQIRGKVVKPPFVSVSETGLNNDVLSLYITKLAQTLPERLKEGRRWVVEAEITYPWDFCSLLRSGEALSQGQYHRN